MDRAKTAGPWTYFVQEKPKGLIKIGLATNPTKRLSGLQTGNGTELVLLAITRQFEEGKLHAKFEKLRVRGEWFAPSDELCAFISATPGIRILAAPVSHTGLTYDFQWGVKKCCESLGTAWRCGAELAEDIRTRMANEAYAICAGCGESDKKDLSACDRCEQFDEDDSYSQTLAILDEIESPIIGGCETPRGFAMAVKAGREDFLELARAVDPYFELIVISQDGRCCGGDLPGWVAFDIERTAKECLQ